MMSLPLASVAIATIPVIPGLEAATALPRYSPFSLSLSPVLHFFHFPKARLTSFTKEILNPAQRLDHNTATTHCR